MVDDETRDMFQNEGGGYSSFIDNFLYLRLGSGDTGRTLVWLGLVAISVLVNAFDDVITAFMVWPRTHVHNDIFNYSIFLGKFLLFIAGFYFNGFVLYKNFFKLIADFVLFVFIPVNDA